MYNSKVDGASRSSMLLQMSGRGAKRRRWAGQGRTRFASRDHGEPATRQHVPWRSVVAGGDGAAPLPGPSRRCRLEVRHAPAGRPGVPTLQLGRHRLTTRRADPGDAGAAGRSCAACVEEREGVTGYNTRVR